MPRTASNLHRIPAALWCGPCTARDIAMSMISPALFRFLSDLAANNTRTWFHAHKPRYEREVREPVLALIASLQPVLAEISPHYRADPRKQGGSMYRIQRDTRYSNDKAPYKTWASVRLAHERRREMEAPSFYLHFEPGHCFVGAGFWHPSGPTLRAFRDFVVDNPASWTRITHASDFTSRFGFFGDSLKRAPSGFDPSHPLIVDLRRKDWVAVRQFDEALACSDALPAFIDESLHGLAPMVDYLCAALDLPF